MFSRSKRLFKSKIKEVQDILKDVFEVVPMSKIGIDVDIEETGITFEENALIKARYVYERTGCKDLPSSSEKNNGS